MSAVPIKNVPKQTWIIKNSMLNDGVILALKNADSLYRSAKALFDNGCFTHSLSIATLALEEFGKHCILKEHLMNGQDVNSDLWNDIIKKHEEKLKAIPKHLEQAGPNKPDQHTKDELDRFRAYLLELAKRKLENLYVDWDSINEKWIIIENSESIKKKARFAVETTHWAIEKYIEGVGWDRDLLFTPIEKITQLFEKKKVHAFCNICAYAMLTKSELLQHRKMFRNHDEAISWHHSD